MSNYLVHNKGRMMVLCLACTLIVYLDVDTALRIPMFPAIQGGQGISQAMFVEVTRENEELIRAILGLRDEMNKMKNNITDLKREHSDNITDLRKDVFKLRTIVEGEGLILLIREAIFQWKKFAISSMTSQSKKSTLGLDFNQIIEQHPVEWAQFCHLVQEVFRFDISTLSEFSHFALEGHHIAHPSLADIPEYEPINWKEFSLSDPREHQVSGDSKDWKYTPHIAFRLTRVQQSSVYQRPHPGLVAMMEATENIARQNAEVVRLHEDGFCSILVYKASGVKIDATRFKAAVQKGKAFKRFLSRAVCVMQKIKV